MIDLSRVPPVIDDKIDPRLHAVLQCAPPGLHIVFAGPDEIFLTALRRLYRVPLTVPDVAVVAARGLIIIGVAPADETADGLCVSMAIAPDGTFVVSPALLFTADRAAGARQRLRPRRGHADQLDAALTSLIFRRVMPTNGGVQ